MVYVGECLPMFSSRSFIVSGFYFVVSFNSFNIFLPSENDILALAGSGTDLIQQNSFNKDVLNASYARGTI